MRKHIKSKHRYTVQAWLGHTAHMFNIVDRASNRIVDFCYDQGRAVHLCDLFNQGKKPTATTTVLHHD